MNDYRMPAVKEVGESRGRTAYVESDRRKLETRRSRTKILDVLAG
ncbi:hypothetical protein FDG2_3160 [Candidatus Protofrankia californiensis]|uniref:Uncharacterized protein n=1 Tax=Candidatus Protofrankia californiensis TaxID=1839754 RepID=A0A1C3NZ50_9ACTN|nr:hypothetical protein FDG2_3160 [Candidatus Protofrankia californiensis]